MWAGPPKDIIFWPSILSTHAWIALSDIDLDFVRSKQYARNSPRGYQGNYRSIVRFRSHFGFADVSIASTAVWKTEASLNLEYRRVCSEPTRSDLNPRVSTTVAQSRTSPCPQHQTEGSVPDLSV